ncbi:putative leucine-rich repeat-containing protein DDB_G0290503 [Ambystoma mexicanum]|uniref:putative leucine-rich repeat-containing protein DDB_G0290503 n=1 Tax=Ambystoma mexicanum TaxID=8296 RepID=UPI0037E7DB24
MENISEGPMTSKQWNKGDVTNRIEITNTEKNQNIFGSPTNQLLWSQCKGVEEDLIEDVITQDNQLYKISTETNVKHHFPINKTLVNLKLLNLKLMHCNYQDSVLNQAAENFSVSAADDEDSDTEHQGGVNERAVVSRKEATSEQEHDLSVMKLLAQCHIKLEELEELKHTSKELARNLRDAKESIAYLSQKVAELVTENSQKEAEINVLSVELTESKSLLREKNNDMAHVKILVRNLSKQLQKKQQELALKSYTEANSHEPDCPDSHNVIHHHIEGSSKPHRATNCFSRDYPGSQIEICDHVTEDPKRPQAKNSRNSTVCLLL